MKKILLIIALNLLLIGLVNAQIFTELNSGIIFPINEDDDIYSHQE